MQDENDIYINRIIQGGIYFLTLQDDMKMRPYVVISKNSGYGMNILAFSITSKCTTASAVLPIVVSNKVSFIRVSGTKEISPKTIIESDFGGIMRPDIFNLAIMLFAQRFITVIESDKLEHEVDTYLNELDEKKYPLHLNSEIIFTKEKFLNNSFSTDKATIDTEPSNKKNRITITKINPTYSYPQDLRKWTTAELKKFRKDMFRFSVEELMKRYNSTEGRIHFLKRNVKLELDKRKERI